MKLATSAQMRALDNEAIDRYGIPGIVLMENAGRGTVHQLVKHFGHPEGRKVAVFVGPGNNGGDGLVIARLLHQMGAFPVIYLLAPFDAMKGDAAINLDNVRNLPVTIRHLLEKEEILAEATVDLADTWLIVDAMFGTGLSRELEGCYAKAVSLINKFPGPVLAVDVPSGINSDTGQTPGPCVQADMTVTYGLPKPGLFIPPGSSCAGQVLVEDIGLPPEAVFASGLTIELLEADRVRNLLPVRPAAGHKGTFGHLLVVAGSLGMTGAALLCGRAALKSGVGLVTLAAPQELHIIYAASLPEAMTLPLLKSTTPWFGSDSFEEIAAAVLGKQAVVLGPGIGTRPVTAELVIRLYKELKVPMVVDADALNILASQPEVLRNPPAPRILTPHPGEMARLVGRTTREIQADRLTIAISFASSHRVFLVLKGAATIVADPDGNAVLNPTGNVGMATGGMGDVLTGVLASLLAQGLSPWDAARLAVYSHGLAGDRLARAMGINLGYTASELAAEIPHAFAELVSVNG